VTAPDLLAALGPLLDLLRGLGVRHFVGGSIASSAHGVARASIDADVVAELRPEHVDRLLSSLRGAYYVPDARVRVAVSTRASFNLIHLETMLKVDVFVSRDRPFDRRAMERAQPAPSEAAGECPLTLASAEDVVLAKLDWFDRRYLEDGARELGVSDLLARALGEAGRR
jgi:hypothetical protein